jgi:hypothetical protein
MAFAAAILLLPRWLARARYRRNVAQSAAVVAS